MKNLTTNTWMKQLDEIAAIRNDPSVDELLKQQVSDIDRNLDYTAQSAFESKLDVIKRDIKSTFEANPNADPETVIEDKVSHYIESPELRHVVETLTDSQAGNLELAVLTKGKSLNRDHLLATTDLPEARKLVLQAVKKTKQKQKAGLLPDTNTNAAETYQIQYATISPMVSEIFSGVLKDYFANNFNLVDGVIQSNAYVSKDQPLNVTQKGVNPKKARNWAIAAFLGGAAVAGLLTGHYSCQEKEGIHTQLTQAKKDNEKLKNMLKNIKNTNYDKVLALEKRLGETEEEYKKRLAETKADFKKRLAAQSGAYDNLEKNAQGLRDDLASKRKNYEQLQGLYGKLDNDNKNNLVAINGLETTLQDKNKEYTNRQKQMKEIAGKYKILMADYS